MRQLQSQHMIHRNGKAHLKEQLLVKLLNLNLQMHILKGDVDP